MFFSLEVGGVSFLAPRLLIGRGVVGRIVVSLLIGWGARMVLALRSLAGGNVHALPWGGASI